MTNHVRNHRIRKTHPTPQHHSENSAHPHLLICDKPSIQLYFGIVQVGHKLLQSLLFIQFIKLFHVNHDAHSLKFITIILYQYPYFFRFAARNESVTAPATNSAATSENQTPFTPKRSGRRRTAAVSKTTVRRNEIAAETKPSLSAVKNEEP